jgi:hypothetical protein
MKPIFKIIDDFLPEEDFKSIRDIMLSPSMPWYYTPKVNDEYDVGNGHYFIHLFHHCGMPSSPFFNRVKPLIKKLKMTEIMRIKGNMYPTLGREHVDGMHVDYPYPHQGAILYVNTNNGCTIMDNGSRINSVANRLLMFDPSRPHDSSYPTDTKVRVNININYYTKEWNRE